MAVTYWHEFFLDLARQTVKMAKRIGGELSVAWKERDIARSIKWSDVDLDEERYVMQLWPVNLLPDTPSGKLAYVEQMITMGLLNPQQGQQLLDFPDIQAFQKLNTAGETYLKMVLDSMLKDGEYIGPEEWDNLELGIKMMQEAIMWYRNRGVSEEKIALLKRWCEDAFNILQPPAPPPEAMPPMQQPPPEAMPPMPEAMPPM
jgi:hypothetical protein